MEKQANNTAARTAAKAPIELRSEKVRHLLGRIPPALTRWNIAVMALVCLALALTVTLVPYPYGGGESILRHLLGARG